MALTVTQSPGGVTSALDSGSVTSPAANQVLCDSGPLGAVGGPAATYVLQIGTILSGTADAAGGGANIFVNVGGTNAAGIISGGQTIGDLLSLPTFCLQRMRVNVPGGSHIYICVGNTVPTAGAVYSATLAASRGWHLLSDT